MGLGLVITLLYIIFALAAIVLIVVILLQEGKGGGLGQALGGHAQTTFGVGASGINRFTGYTAAVFLGAALMIHILGRMESQGSLVDSLGQPNAEQPSDPGGSGGAPAGLPGGLPPAPGGGGM